MSLTRVEPHTSKKTGGVILDLYGLNFGSQAKKEILQEEMLLTAEAKINKGQHVSFHENNIGEAFDIEIEFGLLPKSLPLVDNARLIGIKVHNLYTMSNSVEAYITYNRNKGYILVIETWENGEIKKIEERNTDVVSVETIGLRGCGKYIHGFVKTKGKRLYFGKSSEVFCDAYALSAYCLTPKTGVARELEVLLKKVVYTPSVSFVGTPTEILSWEDRKIRVKTLPGEIDFGDITVALEDQSVVKLIDYGRYVKGSGISSVRKAFDCIQAVYAEHVSPPRNKLFSEREGFSWGEDYFLSESQKNNNLSVPSLWDPVTGNIPRKFFQSGIGEKKDLQYLGIEKSTTEGEEKWFAKIEHGTYFVSNVPYYLFSGESIIEYIGEEKTEDGRSMFPLIYRPKIGIPIVASSLGQDLSTGRLIERKRLQKRGKFTGKIINGAELDSSESGNIDRTKEEFVIRYNSNNELSNWRIPVEGTLAGRYVFNLPKKPLREFKMRFSRTDIFQKEKTIARKYGEAGYDSFLYGEGVVDFGDYAVDYKRNQVEVILERPYSDLGLLSYTYDYPAVVEFNADYTVDRGTTIIDPEFEDLKNLDNMGESNGEPAQKFTLHDFPIIDKSSYAVVDTTNFKLFLYDEYDNSFDTEWKRVSTFEDKGPNDKVYTATPSNGIVAFGDGTRGEIPGKYKRVLSAYKPTLKVQYEPESSNDYWLGKTVDLNLTKQNLNSGFLYLSRKILIPSRIDLEFASSNISAFETTEINSTVYTEDGEVVPGFTVHFEIVEGGGQFQEEELVSNPNGDVNTIFTPSGRLEDIGIKVDSFMPGLEVSEHGKIETLAYGEKNGIPYMSLRANEVIQGDLSDIYLFKILDDGDDFLPYNNITREGGRMVLYHNDGMPVRGDFIAGSVIGFDNQLPQPYDVDSANYDPQLRGFYVIGKKTIQARAYVDVDESRIYSDIVTVTVEYSPLQKGAWRLPVPPVDYESTQINTATYISI